MASSVTSAASTTAAAVDTAAAAITSAAATAVGSSVSLENHKVTTFSQSSSSYDRALKNRAPDTSAETGRKRRITESDYLRLVEENKAMRRYIDSTK
jgi:hypothetical protein